MNHPHPCIQGKMINFKPLNNETWSDLQNLFGEKGACGGCWCMLWRLTHKEFGHSKGMVNKLKLHNLIIIKHEVPLGVLAFDNGIPIGWCSVAPRSSFIRLESSRLFKKFDNRSVWSITCSFVDKNYRRKSLSIKLIREATSFAFNHGTSIVEAYPIIPKINEMPSAFAWIGFVNSFKKAGFQKVAQPSETRFIMRIENH